MVVRPFHQLEWAESNREEAECLPGDRRLANGLGGSMPRNQDRGPLVQGREEAPHKLPRVDGSFPGLQMLLQEQEEHPCPSKDGQHVSSCLHQQNGRDSFPCPEQPEQGVLAVVLGEGHLCTSATPSGQTEQHRGRGIQGHEGQARLETLPTSIPIHQQHLWTTGSGSICLKANYPAANFCELETRPRGHGHGCIHTNLDEHEGICQPPMELSGSSAVPGSPTEGEPSSNSPDLEDPALVSKSPGNVHRLPTNHSGETQPDPGKSYPGNATRNPPASRVDYLRRRYQEQQLSEEATELMLSSWREKSSRSYDSQFQKWISWCRTRSVDPVSCPVGEVVNFLADLFTQGYQYRSLNAFRSAISSVHNKVDGCDVGQHPLVSRLLKGAFHQRPPQPRYTQTWDVGLVTGYIKSKGENKDIPLQDLTHKLAMLMALTRPSRSADLAKLNLDHRSYSVEGVTFIPTELAKQSRQQKHGTEFFFPCYPEDERLCPVLALREYEARTAPTRGSHSMLFLSINKPHKPVSSSTIARWLKTLLNKAGVDTEIFKAHSVRSASTSAAATSGITTGDILKAADWSSEAVFQKFYHKPINSNDFGKAVLSK